MCSVPKHKSSFLLVDFSNREEQESAGMTYIAENVAEIEEIVDWNTN